MKKRIQSYLKEIDALLADPTQVTDWDKAIREHLIQIGFFQHERLIHLIVTITFALMQVLVLGFLLNEFTPLVAALFLLIFVLLVPYISHYYLLENGVQAMYVQYDKMLAYSKTTR